MENIIFEDEFYNEIGEVFEHLDIDESNVNDLPSSYTIEVEDTELQPVYTLSAEMIMENINPDRLDENGEYYDKVFKIIEENVDFTQANNKMPKMYYPAGTKTILTKEEIIKYL